MIWPKNTVYAKKDLISKIYEKNPTAQQQTWLKSRQTTWIDISAKMIYQWPINTRKDARQAFSLWCSGSIVWLVSVEAQVQSLARCNGLRIRCCCNLQLQLGFYPWPRNFHMLWVGSEKKKKKKPAWHYSSLGKCKSIHIHVHSSSIHNNAKVKQPKCPLTDERVNKMCKYRSRNIIQPEKGREFWYVLQYTRTSKTLRSGK